MKNIPIILLTFLATLCSCSNEWLEAKPDQQLTVPETLKDFQGLLDDVSLINQQTPVLGEVSSDLYYVKDQSYNSLIKGQPSDAYIWSKTMRYKSVADWNQAYARILVDNIVLDGLKRFKPTGSLEQQKYNDIKGQALFNRAKAHFEVANVYAEPYKTGNTQSEYGAVLKLEANSSAVSKRSSVKETYDQILQDLRTAVSLLPDKGEFPTRGSKAAAFAMLSRVCLAMYDYEHALEYASSALQLYSPLLDYNDLSQAAISVGRYNAEVIYHSNYSTSILSSRGLFSRSFVDQYDLHDLRRNIFFRENADGSFNFKGNYESSASLLFNGLATDELYITRAECYARLNKVPEAMADLNTLMEKRWDNTVSFQPFTAANPEEALVKILQERKKELVFRNIRWMDLRRLNQDQKFAITVTRILNGTTYTLEPNSYKYTLPIPDDVMDQTDIPQNPEWEK